MKNILAIDTSSSYLSIALKSANNIFCECDLVENKHSFYIINKIQNLLKKAKIEITELDYIAYIEGPGSFTGLRVGLSVSLGISCATGVKLIPIHKFFLYALPLKSYAKVVVAFDARLNQVYLAGINTQDFTYIIQPQVVSPSELYLDNDWTLTGDGFEIYKQKFDITSFTYINNDYPKANNMIELVENGVFKPVDSCKASLMYLRDNVALTLHQQRNYSEN